MKSILAAVYKDIPAAFTFGAWGMNIYYCILLGLWHLREMFNLYFSKTMYSLHSSLRCSAVCFVEPCGGFCSIRKSSKAKGNESLSKVVAYLLFLQVKVDDGHPML
jgi:hypothetical protein